jgi:uncharacterized integral membrane protein
MTTNIEPQIYKGQYGNFVITDSDRLEVIIYRLGLLIAGLSFTAASILILWKGANSPVLAVITPLFYLFCLGLAVSLIYIHIYLDILKKILQFSLLIGLISALILDIKTEQNLSLFIYNNPLSLLGVGFSFVALTGIYFKEAFCFNRLETKFLTVIVPLLLLGHLIGILPLNIEQLLLSIWTLLFLVFLARKATQPIPPDIGDKSVFTYLKQKFVD